MEESITECPDDGYAIGADGRCIACARTPADVLADQANRGANAERTAESEVDLFGNQHPDSRIAQHARALAAESDAARAERGDAPPINAGAYGTDAVRMGIAEIAATVDRNEREPSTESLMRGPSTSGGSSGSKGRTRSNKKALICGEPCDCSSGLPCRLTTAHKSHACDECRGNSGIGRPRTEGGEPRNIHVTGRISQPTAVAIALTGKSTATIMYELARAIMEGRPYDWRNA